MARKRYNFWLDDKRADDWKVNDLIAILKAGGQFTRAIREGLRLWVDCRAGHTTVFCELFPKLAEQLGATVIEKPTPSATGGGGHSELAKEIAAEIILQGGTPGYLMQSAAAPSSTGKLLGGNAPPPMPIFEDEPDEPTVLIRASTSNDSSMNFVSAMRSVQ